MALYCSQHLKQPQQLRYQAHFQHGTAPSAFSSDKSLHEACNKHRRGGFPLPLVAEQFKTAVAAFSVERAKTPGERYQAQCSSSCLKPASQGRSLLLGVRSSRCTSGAHLDSSNIVPRREQARKHCCASLTQSLGFSSYL